MAEKKDKLIIIRGKFQGSEVEFSSQSSDAFKVCFNPTDYTISKKTSYAEAAVPGLDSPIIQFNRGEARILND